MSPSVTVYDDADALASVVAIRLVERLRDAQDTRGDASIVLTGGRIAEKLYTVLRSSPDRDTVDWSRVDVWWGDERFLATGDADRNETRARAALLDALPLDPARVHPMPATDGPDGSDPEAGALRYAAELVARFDVVLLGIGEDGHVASIFPGHPVAEETRSVAAVRNSPKPPPTRITLTLPMINTADEVWLIASGDGKAAAVGQALAGTGTVPAANAHGVRRTLWLLDRDAAAEVPASLR